MTLRTEAPRISPTTKSTLIEDPAPNPEQMQFGIEAITDAGVVLAIRYLDPDLEGFEGILIELPSDEEIFLAIQYLDPDLNVT